MLQVSAKTEYGMRCLRLLAAQPEGQSVSTSEIAQREHLPKAYADQIMLKLRRSGLVKSIRGNQGGFTLARPAEEISVGEVLRALERQAPQNMCDHFNRRCECGHMADCSIRPVWDFVAHKIWDTLDRISLRHLVSDERTVTHALASQLPILSCAELTRRPGC